MIRSSCRQPVSIPRRSLLFFTAHAAQTRAARSLRASRRSRAQRARIERLEQLLERLDPTPAPSAAADGGPRQESGRRE